MPRLSERTRGRLLLAWIVVFTALTFYAVGQNRKLGEQGREAHDALCAFKADLERRANDTAQFIAEIRSDERPPIPGISIADLERSLRAQRATVRSLHEVECE